MSLRVFLGTVVTTFAGGVSGTVGAFRDGIGSQAGFNQARSVAEDVSGSVIVADRFNSRVRKVSPGGGTKMSQRVGSRIHNVVERNMCARACMVFVMLIVRWFEV